MNDELLLDLQDTQWPFEYTDCERSTARAIVFDREGMFYFIRLHREDEFGPAELIETSGGGIEEGETPEEAVVRELKEELGADVRILRKIGLVRDHYNLIHRRNLNHYFLCEALSFGEKNLTWNESEILHFSTLRVSLEEAIRDYERHADTRLGILIYNREMPVLLRARELLKEERENGPRE